MFIKTLKLQTKHYSISTYMYNTHNISPILRQNGETCLQIRQHLPTVDVYQSILECLLADILQVKCTVNLLIYCLFRVNFTSDEQDLSEYYLSDLRHGLICRAKTGGRRGLWWLTSVVLESWVMSSINMLRQVWGKGHSASVWPAECAVAQDFRWEERRSKNPG